MTVLGSEGRPVTPMRARPRRGRLSAQARAGLLFIAPALLYLSLVQVVPILYALYLSFTDYSPIARGAPNWVGAANYVAMLTSPEFHNALSVTLRFAAAVIVLNIAVALGLALLLEFASRQLRWLQVVIFLPVVTSITAVSIVWMLLYDPTFGLLNQLLSAVGLPGQPWLASVAWALPSLVIMRVWRGAGWNAVIYRAALQNIPKDLIQAAQIDGATNWQIFRFIILPLLRPVTLYIVIVGLVSTLQTFAEVFIMTGGGPLGSTTTIGFLIYRQAFEHNQIGLASATSFVLFLVIFLLSFIGFYYFRRGST